MKTPSVGGLLVNQDQLIKGNNYHFACSGKNATYNGYSYGQHLFSNSQNLSYDEMKGKIANKQVYFAR